MLADCVEKLWSIIMSMQSQHKTPMLATKNQRKLTARRAALGT
jgi:hypothetical protein